METVVHYRTSTEAFCEYWHGYCTHIILHNVYELIVLSCKQLQHLGRYACPPFWKPYLDIFWKLLRTTFRIKDETSEDRKLQHNEKLRGLYWHEGVKYSLRLYNGLAMCLGCRYKEHRYYFGDISWENKRQKKDERTQLLWVLERLFRKSEADGPGLGSCPMTGWTFVFCAPQRCSSGLEVWTWIIRSQFPVNVMSWTAGTDNCNESESASLTDEASL